MMTPLSLKTSTVVTRERTKYCRRLLVLSWLLLSCVCSAQRKPPFKLLHSFGGSGDGDAPSSGVVFDGDGNLYGTTSAGGALGYGTVYELSPEKDGTWTESILHNFPDPHSVQDGSEPSGGVVMDRSGDVYGTAQLGGEYGRGIVFELISGASGWTESVLHNFCSLEGCTDGGGPITAPILDSAGNLYGGTDSGSGQQGVIYELMPSGWGWEESVLYTFCSLPQCVDGERPGQVVMDKAGNLYGPTSGGGVQQGGVVFVLRIPKRQGGAWTEQVLHDFTGSDGAFPSGIVLQGADLYGIAGNGGGGGCGCGTIFELTPTADVTAGANYTVLHQFTNFSGGEYPLGAPVFDKAGNMYGVASFGGAPCGCGLVWELKRVAGGWQYEILHVFTGSDGVEPSAGLTIDGEGNLYGTTIGGSTGGVVFEILHASPTAK